MSHLRFYKVMRAPLELPKGPKVHWGFAIENIYTREFLVLHNTPGKNTHIGDIEEFHAGLEWSYEPIPYSDEIYRRFLAAAKNGRQYDLIVNNCQQTYTGIVDGFSWTPVVWFAVIIVVGGLVIYTANRSGASA
jgi:hypothetical protein